MKPISRSVYATRPAGHASALARMEARRLGHHYLGAEHLLLGLPVHGPNPIRLLVEARGLTLQTLREALLGELDRDRR